VCFGAAYARAAVLEGPSFAAQSDPSDLHPMRRGALFGTLLVDPIFLRKKLDMSRDAAAKTTRRVAATLLAQVRLDATRTLVDFATSAPSEIEEATTDAFKVRVPREWAGVLPRPDPRASPSLAGVLL